MKPFTNEKSFIELVTPVKVLRASVIFGDPHIVVVNNCFFVLP